MITSYYITSTSGENKTMEHYWTVYYKNIYNTRAVVVAMVDNFQILKNLNGTLVWQKSQFLTTNLLLSLNDSTTTLKQKCYSIRNKQVNRSHVDL